MLRSGNSAKNGDKACRGNTAIAESVRLWGATYPHQLQELRAKLPHTFFLVPGYGAQGGAAKDVAPAFDSDGLGAVINASRSILCAWQKTGAAEQDYAKAAAREAVRMRDEIMAEIGTISL